MQTRVVGVYYSLGLQILTDTHEKYNLDSLILPN
jgi:hypothetical protein